MLLAWEQQTKVSWNGNKIKAAKMLIPNGSLV